MSHTHHHAFRFYANGEEFFPHAGTRLAFVNRGIDTLTLKSLPPDTLAGGDAVIVTYAPTAEDDETTVFQGTVEQITASTEGGPANALQDAVVSSPWSKMDRLIYQQQWYGYTSQGLVWSSNLVLNQDYNGNSIGFKRQLKEIFDFAADRCGIDYTDPTAPSTNDQAPSTNDQALPFDEVRDLSCAQAVNRVLRWFPKKIVRFDYSGETPNLELADPSAASWVSGIDKASIVRTYNAHPINGVYLEIVTTGDDNGVAYRHIGYQKHPITADPTAVDCLHATVMLAGGSSSSSYESVKFHCEYEHEAVAQWWKAKHARLSKYDTNNIRIDEHSSDDHDDTPNITDATVEELTKFGLKAKVVTFTAKVTVEDDDETEENLVLQMKFVMSNAEDDKTYTRTVGSSATTGETMPAGLAKAIYDDRSQALQSLKCVARLGASFPKVGETYEGLILQGFEVDPYELTAECSFGQPEHLSPDDMAGIMTGFRNRVRSTSCWERKDGTKGGADDDIPSPIHPMSATEFCPGLKAKTTIKSSSGGGGSITLDASDLDDGEDIAVREMTVGDKNGHEKTVKVLASEDFTAGGVTSVNGQSGALNVIGGEHIKVSTDGDTITISYDEDKEEPDPDPSEEPEDPCAHPGDSDNEGGVPGDDDDGSGGGGAGIEGFGGDDGGVSDSGEPHPGDDDCTNC